MQNSGDKERTALKELRNELKGLQQQAEIVMLRQRIEKMSSLLDVVQI